MSQEPANTSQRTLITCMHNIDARAIAPGPFWRLPLSMMGVALALVSLVVVYNSASTAGIQSWIPAALAVLLWA
ncbi:MAG: hypothetical protein ACREV2_03805, partial [Burkholderiales bacterium]